MRCNGRRSEPRRKSKPRTIHAPRTRIRPRVIVTAPSAVAAVPFGTSVRMPRSTDESVGPVGPTATPETVISTMPIAPDAPRATVVPRGHRLPSLSPTTELSILSTTGPHYGPTRRPVAGLAPPVRVMAPTPARLGRGVGVMGRPIAPRPMNPIAHLERRCCDTLPRHAGAPRRGSSSPQHLGAGISGGGL